MFFLFFFFFSGVSTGINFLIQAEFNVVLFLLNPAIGNV